MYCRIVKQDLSHQTLAQGHLFLFIETGKECTLYSIKIMGVGKDLLHFFRLEKKKSNVEHKVLILFLSLSPFNAFCIGFLC